MKYVYKIFLLSILILLSSNSSYAVTKIWCVPDNEGVGGHQPMPGRKGFDPCPGKTFNKVKRFKLLFLFRLIHPIIEKVLEKKLLSHRPKLFYFDMYKLSFLIHYSK